MTNLASNAWRVLKTNWGTLKDLLDVDFVSNWVIKDEFREFMSRRFDLHFQTSSEFSKARFHQVWNSIGYRLNVLATKSGWS